VRKGTRQTKSRKRLEKAIPQEMKRTRVLIGELSCDLILLMFGTSDRCGISHVDRSLTIYVADEDPVNMTLSSRSIDRHELSLLMRRTLMVPLRDVADIMATPFSSRYSGDVGGMIKTVSLH
jgi:hypothetical protein